MTPVPPHQPPARRIRWLAAVLATALAATSCGFGDPPPDQAGEPPVFPTPSTPVTTAPADGQTALTVVAKDLDVPWAVAFLPDGAALVTERDTARILRVGPESTPDGLRVTAVQTIEEADPAGEGGLLGIAVSPAYQRDKTVFIYYTTRADNRIAKLVLGQRPQPIVTGIPISGIHNGGRLAFGPDGHLYATTGDASQRGLSQNLRSLGGKILRMTPDGKPAPGNPFNTLIWSYGHRNVQGIAWDAAGRLYATEFGSNRFDEVNRIEPGKNYGWPDAEGKANNSRYVDPLVQFPTNESSCSGAAVLGSMLVSACLRGQRLWLMELTAGGTILGAPKALLQGRYGRLRAVVAAPDGSLWLTTSNRDQSGDAGPDDDRIIRLVLAGAGGAVRG